LANDRAYHIDRDSIVAITKITVEVCQPVVLRPAMVLEFIDSERPALVLLQPRI
jgi:hypothetical protein